MGPLMIFSTFAFLSRFFRAKEPPSISKLEFIKDGIALQVLAVLPGLDISRPLKVRFNSETGKMLGHHETRLGQFQVEMIYRSDLERWVVTDDTFHAAVQQFQTFTDPVRRAILEGVMRLGDISQVSRALAEIRHLKKRRPSPPPADPALANKTKVLGSGVLEEWDKMSRANLEQKPGFKVLISTEGYREKAAYLIPVPLAVPGNDAELYKVVVHASNFLALIPADTPEGQKPKEIIEVEFPDKEHPIRKGQWVHLVFAESPFRGGIDLKKNPAVELDPKLEKLAALLERYQLEDGEPLSVVDPMGEPYYAFFPRANFPLHRTILGEVEGVHQRSQTIAVRLLDERQAQFYGTFLALRYQGENPFRPRDPVMLVRPIRGAAGEKPTPPRPPWERPRDTWTALTGETFVVQHQGLTEGHAEGWLASLMEFKPQEIAPGDPYRGGEGVFRATFCLITGKSAVEKIVQGKVPSSTISFLISSEEAGRMEIPWDKGPQVLDEFFRRVSWLLVSNSPEPILFPGGQFREIGLNDYVLQLGSDFTGHVLGRGEGALGQAFFLKDSQVSRRHVRIWGDAEVLWKVQNLSENNSLTVWFREDRFQVLAPGEATTLKGRETLGFGKSKVHLVPPLPSRDRRPTLPDFHAQIPPLSPERKRRMSWSMHGEFEIPNEPAGADPRDPSKKE